MDYACKSTKSQFIIHCITLDRYLDNVQNKTSEAPDKLAVEGGTSCYSDMLV